MEAGKVTEEPHTGSDAEEHPSPKDPAAEDFQEPQPYEVPVEPSISETPLEPHSSMSPEVPVEPSISETPLEPHSSMSPEVPVEPSISETPLEPHSSMSPEVPVEPSISETPLEPHSSMSPEVPVEPSISETPLEPHSSMSPEVPVEPSISETPLEPHSSMSPLEPSGSNSPLGTHTSETPLEHSASGSLLEVTTSQTPLEINTSESLLAIYPAKIPLKQDSSRTPSKTSLSGASVGSHTSKDLVFQPSASSSKDDARKEVLHIEPSSSEAPQTKMPTLEAPDIKILPKPSLSGRSAQVHKDSTAGQKEEAEKGKEGAAVSDSTAPTAQPGCQLGKKKGKKPASRLYIGWRCPHYLWDCFRIGDESRCFCGHLLKEHRIISGISVPCGVSQCRCLMFCFIPSRPEEVGEFWLTRRATFNPKAWRAQCRCKHSHEDHLATGSHPCRHQGCYCRFFESNFLCAACDRRWEEHETFFETGEARRRGGRPHGADYLPFAEMPALQEVIQHSSDLTAQESQGPSGLPSSQSAPPGLPGPNNPQRPPRSDTHT
ncbi:protein FAM221B isoform X2 [Echinops telfairi]|uniref:Protein FAM221B isoform X2 n=1 Tax=Echinops telfairi TaxID=9371 RepID=A0AC55CZW7_ECHTE|nr:protein FAM221B isoform X2 [Echinops telfairi]